MNASLRKCHVGHPTRNVVQCDTTHSQQRVTLRMPRCMNNNIVLYNIKHCTEHCKHPSIPDSSGGIAGSDESMYALAGLRHAT